MIHSSRAKLDLADVRIEAYRATGAGGQNRNRRMTACRVVHEPTGLIVTNADQRNWGQNRARALEVSQSRLDDMHAQEHHEEVNAQRTDQMGSGSFLWTQWRDEVKSDTGRSMSYKQALKGRLTPLIK